MRLHRTTTTAVALTLALGLTACGGEDEAEETTPEVTTPAATPDDAAAETGALGTPTDIADETTEETTEAEESTDAATATEEATAGAGTEDGVPELADIWPDVIANAQAAEAVTATISGVQGGEELEATLTGQMDDSNFQVDIRLDDANAVVMADEGEYFINGDEGFWEMSGAPDPSALAGEWVEAPAEAGIGEQFSLSALWEDFFQAVPTDAGSLRTSSAELADLDGVEAYHYVVQGENAEIWVSADGEDNLLRVLIDEDSEEPMEITTSDWNDVDPIDPPTDAVPIEELVGG